MSSLQRNLQAIANQRFDVVIIGGGITGAGVARHAAMLGLSVALLEADDFSAGTSSRSTKLIHGGLRYLAMGDFALVRESALERKSLYQMAPHLTQPQWMIIPARSRAEMLKIRAGVSIYEKLGAVAAADRHRNWNVAALSKEEPLLNSAEYPFACAYREYLTDDARLVLANLRSAGKRGAQICNYASVRELRQSEDGVAVSVSDALTDERFELTARVVVNATGPWVEQDFQPHNSGARAHRLHLSKGVHVGVPRQRLPVRNMIMLTAADRRPVFAIPRGTVTYIGTTDTTASGRPEHWPSVAASEVEYLLEPIGRYFCVDELSPGDVVSSWAGLRALINQPGKAPKEMSRKDEIWCDGRVVSVAGGKLTGFRKIAEQVMQEVSRLLGCAWQLDDPLSRLPGGERADVLVLEGEVAERYGLSAQIARRLTRLYGSEVFTVLGAEPEPVSEAVFAEEIHWAVNEESACRLEDVVYRRLRIPWFRPAESQAVSVAAARLLRQSLHWSEAQERAELHALEQRLRADLAFKNQS